ncbi:hypothetical protein [Bradyrhizobium liaoningense]|jgi:hypothetical protein|uniref:hypothetical protein n=1 Tax=Bradyrhizobium liaoningense TaxID=43992 RepID=UPI000554F653|nr:hypothetical protein [Bradyrhizobium liaoningense]
MAIQEGVEDRLSYSAVDIFDDLGASILQNSRTDSECEVMPRVLYINEKFGHDATIILDSGDACWISVGKGVLVRSHTHSFWGGLLGSLFGSKLYQERDVYRALSVAQALADMFRPVPQIQCRDVILKAFCTAVWHSSSPARVKDVLNNPALLDG